ncbi:ABC transporter substrate-binding protein [Streptomyces sp. RS10V-4]|uniref:ABC transporter substrate-binding protein n=1 Tax=Streptomyces rhizoryzae TaxID=2932493 RepID=UPI002003D439|nr:ABC transporter substrate-binding protein [Streptomyces rhizoryzae]MCK7622501.1 ABC transporter substrate-binding protein [Streptomyces rhizoryzae]
MGRRALCVVRRLAVAVVMGGTLAGCGGAAGDGASGNDGPGDGRGGRTSVAVRPLAPARTVTDGKGVTVRTPSPPKRVVCLVALCDDMLAELGMRPVASTSRLLAHEKFLGRAEAAKIPSVPGGFLSPEAEAILSFRPDLVIGLKDTHGKLAPALKGATAFWPVEPESWQDSVGYLRNLAALTGRTEEGERAERAFRKKLAAAERAPSGRTALVMFGTAENFGVATPGTDVTAGLLPKIVRYPWRSRGVDGTYSMEEILARHVDVLFVESLAAGGPGQRLSDRLARNPLWARIPAVRNGKVIEVDPEVWAKGRGTRSLGIVLDEATAALR